MSCMMIYRMCVGGGGSHGGRMLVTSGRGLKLTN